MSSDSGSEDGGGGGGGGGGRKGGGGQRRGADRGEELATKVLSIQSKRFYLDVKQNERGRFIKFAEVAGGGKKSRIFMTMRTSSTFKELLEKFAEEVDKLGGDEPPQDTQPTLIHSETIVHDKRRYFLDLRENNRGRFLRVTQSSMSGTRYSIALPAQGIVQLKEALAELIGEYGEGYMDDPEDVEVPESRSMRADNKNFYFDPGHNERGDYLKISEVKPSVGIRSSITVSAHALPQFIELLTDLQQKIVDLRAVAAEGGGGAKEAAK